MRGVESESVGVSSSKLLNRQWLVELGAVSVKILQARSGLNALCIPRVLGS